MPKKISIEEFIKQANEIHNNRYDYSLSIYLNNRTKIKIICPEHGVFEQLPSSHINKKYGCYKCAKISSTEDFIKKAKEIHGNKYDYDISKYHNSKTKIKINCQKHGEFLQLPDIHIRGSGCKKCFKDSKKYTTERFITLANKKHNEKYIYTKCKYINSSTDVIITCKEHGDFSINPTKHLMGSQCYLCLMKDKFLNNAKNKHGDTYTYDNVIYENAHKKVIITCKKHGNFEQLPTNHISDENGCPKCFSRISKQEKCVSAFIKTLNIPIVENSKKIIFPYEIDIFIPSHYLAIEYCGLYWHSELYKDKKYHANKLKLCQEKGIRLITIFEDEWLYRQEQVKAKLKSILNIDDREKIFARKCNIVSLTKSQKTSFLEESHIQGDGPGSISYGLEHNGEIVAAIAFINQNYGKYVLNRYATSKQVPGGFSKLLEHFKRNNDWKEIITFADLRWSEGELYENCGFKLDKVLKPDYEYVNIEKLLRIHKFNYRHKNLKNKLKRYDNSLSEHENCLKNKIHRIYDCGKKRYIILI